MGIPSTSFFVRFVLSGFDGTDVCHDLIDGLYAFGDLGPVFGQNESSVFPSKDSADGYLSGNAIRRIKAVVENDLDVKFNLRMCRRTFGQRYRLKNVLGGIYDYPDKQTADAICS